MNAIRMLALGCILLPASALAAPSDCSQAPPCLPAALRLTPAQQQALQDIYRDSDREREALREQIRSRVLRTLTPEQIAILKAHSAEIMAQQARRLRDSARRAERQASRERQAQQAQARAD